MRYDKVAIVWGEGTPSTTPRYWKSALVPTDAALPYTPLLQTMPLYPDAAGQEHLFREAVIAVRHTAGVTLQLTPIVNGVEAPATAASGTVSVDTLRPTFTLPQQPSGAELVRATMVVPLVRTLSINGVEFARFYLRGESLAIRLEAVTQVGNGQLYIDAIDIDHTPLKRTQFGLEVRA